MTSPINVATQKMQRLIGTCDEFVGDLFKRKISPYNNTSEELAEITEQVSNMQQLMRETYQEAKKLDLGEKTPESMHLHDELNHLDRKIKELGRMLVQSQEGESLMDYYTIERLLEKAEYSDAQALRHVKELVQGGICNDYETEKFFFILKDLAGEGNQQALSDLKEFAGHHESALMELTSALTILSQEGNEQALTELIELAKDHEEARPLLITTLEKLIVKSSNKRALMELHTLARNHEDALTRLSDLLNLFKATAKLMQKLSDSETAQIMNTLKESVKNDKINYTKFIQILKQLSEEGNILALSNLNELASTNDPFVFTVLSNVSIYLSKQIQYKDLFNSTSDNFVEKIFPYLDFETMPPVQITVLCTAYLIPMESRSLFFKEPSDLNNPFEELMDQLENLYGENQFIKTIVKSLENKLNTLTHPFLLSKLAFFTQSMHTILGLHDEHPLLLRAIEINSALDTEGVKNPAPIFKKQLEGVTEKPNFIPPTIEVEGTKVSFNLSEIQTVLASMTIPRSALHSDVTWEKWKNLIQQIESKKDNPAVQAAIDDQSIGGWNVLKSSCLSDEDFFRHRIEFTGDPVPINYAQLNAILHKIFNLSDDGSPLSEKEDLLIKFAESVKNCPGGKFEGVSLYYTNGLESKDKFTIEIPNEPDPSRAKAKSILAEQYQNALIETFNGPNPLMQELTGVADVEQASHQSIYLKNMIAHIVGLQHNLHFDLHTAVLYDKLLERPREELLEIFFKHFSPQVLVDHVHTWMNQDTETPGRKNWDKVFQLVVPADEDAIWNEETMLPTTVNKSYARKVLEAAGYLTAATA